MKTQFRIAVAMMLILLSACATTAQQQVAAQLASDLADQLGRTASNQILVFRSCGEHCTQDIVFETSLDAKTLDAFVDDAKIRSKGSYEAHGITSRMANFLFDLVESGDKNKIAVNGIRLKFGDNMDSFTAPGEYWGWERGDKLRIRLNFYETSKSSDQFEFNGKLIKGNLLHLYVHEVPARD